MLRIHGYRRPLVAFFSLLPPSQENIAVANLLVYLLPFRFLQLQGGSGGEERGGSGLDGP